MKKIVAIGGGEIGRAHLGGGFYPVETTKIDKQTIFLTGKKNPKLLFIPTASSDSVGYYEVVKKHFSKLGCKTDVLYLLNNKPSKKQLRDKILSSDIIYVGGGNTLKMMTVWRRLGVDVVLKEAYQKGIVLSGVSAGAICWFSYGNSDSRRFSSGSKRLIKVAGLGLIDALFCPHYDFESHRQKDLKRMMKQTGRVTAIAADNSAAIEILDDQYRIVTSKKSAKVYKIFWKKGEYHQERLLSDNMYRPLSDLLKK